METFVRGEVVVIDFPYTNFGEFKRRPVLIVKVPEGKDIIVLQITGSSHRKEVEIELSNKDFSSGSLKRDSLVRIDKIASIEKSLVKYKVGSLKQQKFESIMAILLTFLANK